MILRGVQTRSSSGWYLGDACAGAVACCSGIGIGASLSPSLSLPLSLPAEKLNLKDIAI